MEEEITTVFPLSPFPLWALEQGTNPPQTACISISLLRRRGALSQACMADNNKATHLIEQLAHQAYTFRGLNRWHKKSGFNFAGMSLILILPSKIDDTDRSEM